NRCARIGRAVVDDDDLERRVPQSRDGAQALGERRRAVVRANDDGDEGPGPVEPPDAVVGLPYRPERGFGLASAIGDAEVPIEHLVVAAMPFVRPGEDERPRATRVERDADLRLQPFRLLAESLAAAVDPDLGDEQRFLGCEILETRQVPADLAGLVEIEV